jgi:hypothetical protein
MATGHLKPKNLASAIALLDGSVLSWHMTDWFLTACCLYMGRAQDLLVAPVITY